MFSERYASAGKTGQNFGAPLRIVETVVDVNDRRKEKMAAKIIKACGGSVQGKTIAILGLAFKPNTDDMREAPSLVIIDELKKAGATIRAFDPEAMDQAKTMLDGVSFTQNAYECVAGADALAIVTEWDAFRALDLDRVKKAMKSPTVIDLRNIYRPDDMRKRGFSYVSVGRG